MASAVLGVRALLLLAMVRLWLPRSGTSATLRRLSTRRRRPADVAPDRALSMVRRAARLVGGECLAQSVTLTVLLQRSGRDPVLVLGCHRYQDRRWGAHAWVEVDDDILDPQPSGDHTSLAWYREADGWRPTAPALREPGAGGLAGAAS